MIKDYGHISTGKVDVVKIVDKKCGVRFSSVITCILTAHFGAVDGG